MLMLRNWTLQISQKETAKDEEWNVVDLDLNHSAEIGASGSHHHQFILVFIDISGLRWRYQIPVAQQLKSHLMTPTEKMKMNKKEDEETWEKEEEEVNLQEDEKHRPTKVEPKEKRKFLNHLQWKPEGHNLFNTNALMFFFFPPLIYIGEGIYDK